MKYFSAELILIISYFIGFTLADEPQTPLQSYSNTAKQRTAHKIAIIGAGAAGSSAAFHLSLYANSSKSDIPLDITVFDTGSRIGGRTTTINALDDPRYPTEVGASIFVKVNHILFNATRDFGLDTKDRGTYSTGSAFDLGIWDGSDFVFTLANDDEYGASAVKGRWKGWWDIAKLLWKYGLAPIRTQRATKRAIGEFLHLYDTHFPFPSLTEAVADLGLEEYTGVSGRQALDAAGVSEKFSRELIQASTRVNYAQNLDSIHGLETLVCMAIEGAMAVEGGNWQIFDEAVKRSGAKVRLNNAVTKVAKTDKETFIVSTNTSRSDEVAFDTVILAAPYHQSNIEFDPVLPIIPKNINYVSLHVTLFTSPHRPSPNFFNLTSQTQVPDSILTTLPPSKLPSGEEDAVGPTNFWSLSTLRVLEPELDAFPKHTTSQSIPPQPKSPLGRQYLYKIFSPTPISASFLASLFNLNHTTTSPSPEFQAISTLPEKDITWSHVRVWNSYPYLDPTTEFDAFRLDDDGVWYTAGMEAFISTMETSALSGRNVARLIVDGLEGRGGEVIVD